jgi:hypothetical protein
MSNRRGGTSAFPRDAEWEAKYDKIHKLCEVGKKDDMFFLQVWKLPLTYLYLMTGDIKAGGDGKKREVHMHMVGEPEGFPKAPHGVTALIDDGYRKHVARVVRACKEGASTDETVLPLAKWKRLFHVVTERVDSLIYAHHGIQCHLDGDLNNTRTDNVMYLHVSDVINIIACRLDNIDLPEVTVRTSLFSTVDSRIRDVLTRSGIGLSGEGLDFFHRELDYFYTLYGYYGNGSFLSIRTKVDENSTRLAFSSFFTNNEHFLTHQHVKLNELNRTETTLYDNLIFRSK